MDFTQTIEELEIKLQQLEIDACSIRRVIELLREDKNTEQPKKKVKRKYNRRKPQSTDDSGKNQKSTEKESGEEVETGKRVQRAENTTETICENTCDDVNEKFEETIKTVLIGPCPRPEKQKCSRCKKELPATEKYFHENPTNMYGLNLTCRECVDSGRSKRKNNLCQYGWECESCGKKYDIRLRPVICEVCKNRNFKEQKPD